VLVLAHDDGVALLLGDGHGHDLARQMAGGNRGRCLFLAGQGHAVLGFALDPKSSATFSAVSGMESTPYWAFISLLTKRQPMVVS
jgi:hypothetical protein